MCVRVWRCVCEGMEVCVLIEESEPHTSGTALHYTCVCPSVRLRPYTVNLKCAQIFPEN